MEAIIKPKKFIVSALLAIFTAARPIQFLWKTSESEKAPDMVNFSFKLYMLLDVTLLITTILHNLEECGKILYILVSY